MHNITLVTKYRHNSTCITELLLNQKVFVYKGGNYFSSVLNSTSLLYFLQTISVYF